MVRQEPYIDPNNPPRAGQCYLEVLLFVRQPHLASDYCYQHGLPTPSECPRFPGPTLRFRRYISSLRESVALYVPVPAELCLVSDPDYDSSPADDARKAQLDLRTTYLRRWRALKQLPLISLFTARRIIYLRDDTTPPVVLRDVTARR